MIEERIARIEQSSIRLSAPASFTATAASACPIRLLRWSDTQTQGNRRSSTGLPPQRVLSADICPTLDPTLRAVELPRGVKAILSDTVGFISDLPTMLVAAFRATLEEVIEADVILHVRDVSNGDSRSSAA